MFSFFAELSPTVSLSYVENEDIRDDKYERRKNSLFCLTRWVKVTCHYPENVNHLE